MRLSNIIKNPVITEKSLATLRKTGEYTFKVALSARKDTIVREFKNLFDVDVIGIRTCIMPGKKRRILGTPRFTKTSKWKKAVVKLAEGQTLDMFPSVEK